jgi:hypothetical protein
MTNKIQTFPDAVSFDTAYVINDYPYGYNLRCEKRCWVDTKYGKNQKIVGQRLVECTKNPKTGRWNKPKASTYGVVVALWIDEDSSYVKCLRVTNYSSVDELKSVLDRYELSPFQTEELQTLIKTKELITEAWKRAEARREGAN